jgi:hypothetical protein
MRSPDRGVCHRRAGKRAYGQLWGGREGSGGGQTPLPAPECGSLWRLPTVQPFPCIAWISLVHAFGTLLLGGSLLSGTGAAVLACGIRGERLGGDHKGQRNNDEKLVHRGAAASEPRPRAALVHEGHRIWSSYVACFEMLDPKTSIRDKFSDCAV